MNSVNAIKGKIKILVIAFAGVLLMSSLQKVMAQLPVQTMLREKGLLRQKEKDSVDRFLRPDSYYLNKEEKLDRQRALYMQEIGKSWLKGTRSSLTALVQDSIKDAGELEVGFNGYKGGLHNPQAAFEQKNANLSTWGIRQLGRIKLAGYFSFDRVWEDSLSNNLSSHLDGRTPYYYFAGKAGKFQRQIYNMGFLLGYDVLKDRLYLGLGADYMHNSSTGSVDPRPEDNWMQAIFKPGLTYKKGNTLVGLSLIKGYGRDDISIKYKNKMFETGNANPDRDYYLNMGYGSIVKKNDLVYDQVEDHEGVSLDFARHWNRIKKSYILRGAFTYQKSYTDSRYQPDTLLIYDKLARWSEGTYNGSLQFKTSSNTRTSLWDFVFNRFKGHDSNTIFGGRNYFSTDNHLGVRFMQFRSAKIKDGYASIQDVKQNDLKTVQISKNTLSWEWGGHAYYNELNRQDILAAHSLDGENLEAGLSGAVYIPEKNFSLWKFSLNAGLWYPLTMQASVPGTQQNYFTTQIFYPIINYLSTPKINADFSLGYSSPKLIKGVYSGFELQAGYEKGLNVKEGLGTLELPAGIDLSQYNPSGKAHRLFISLAFKLYL